MIVHLVTDRRRLGSGTSWLDDRQCLMRQAGHAIAAGIDVIHVRERDLEARELVQLVSDLVARAEGSRTRILVNDRLDVALSAGAHGVHLRADSFPRSRVRTLVPDGFLVGCSVHSVREAQDASEADYLLAGTVWASASKPRDHRLLGLDGLAAIVGASGRPVLAIGGVTADRVEHIRQAGAAGVAAIGLFMEESRDRQCRAVPLDDTLRGMRDRFDTFRSRS
jgi:thiamine-phosphate diphosphorylase